MNQKSSTRPYKIKTESAHKVCRLDQNVPNPFRDFTEISFSISRKERVQLLILNDRKKVVHRLFDGRLGAGSYTIVWDGKTQGGESIEEGYYTYKMETDHFVAIRKLEINSDSQLPNEPHAKALSGKDNAN